MPEQVHLLEALSWLGVIMLLILTGLETDLDLIARKGKGALGISLGGILLPFAAGVALGFVIPGEFVARADQRGVFALFVGTAMSISAIPVIAKVLMDMDLIRRDVGQITLAAGMIDDTMGWILLSVVAGLAASGVVDPASVGKSIASVLIVLGLSLTVGRRLVAALIRAVDNRVGGDMAKISTLMLLALALGSLTQALGLEAVLGAFIAGVLVGRVKRFDHHVAENFKLVALGIFAPVFFAVSGLRVDLAQLLHPGVILVAGIVLAVAIIGKFAGVYIGARLTRLGHWEALSLGAGMNARGAMEIIVATIGLSLGILTPKMYSIILLTAIVTSLMAPPLLRWTIGKVEMGEEERRRLQTEDLRRESFVGNLKRVLLLDSGDGASDLAARLVGLMLRGEDVEVTTMQTQRPADAGDDGAKAGAEEHLEQLAEWLGLESHNARTLTLPEDSQLEEEVLAEVEKGYDLVVIGTGALKSSEQSLRESNGGAGTGLRRWLRPWGTRREKPAQAQGPANGHQARSPGTTYDNSPFKGPLFSELVDKLIHHAPCPIFIVTTPHSTEELQEGVGNGHAAKPGDPIDLQRVLLPVWGSHGVSWGAEIGFSIARQSEMEVDVLHWVSAPKRRLRAGWDDATKHAMDIGEDLVGKVAEFGEWLEATVRTEVSVAEVPEQACIDHAKRHPGLIVLESTRSPVRQRAFFGHDVDYLLRHAPCPVALISAPQANHSRVADPAAPK
jgi:Kef-type K+ transport system membrane component KefB/nucleotide-binding universal stress UspA family protein